MRQSWQSTRERSASQPSRICDPQDCRQRVARWKLLSFSRKLARRCGRRQRLGLCTIDDVLLDLKRHGHRQGALGTTAGSVFRTGDWHPTCLRVRSRRRHAHGREIKVWQLARNKGGGRPRERSQRAEWGFGILARGHRFGKRGSPSSEPLFSCPRCGEVLPAAWSVTRRSQRICLFCAASEFGGRICLFRASGKFEGGLVGDDEFAAYRIAHAAAAIRLQVQGCSSRARLADRGAPRGVVAPVFLESPASFNFPWKPGEKRTWLKPFRPEQDGSRAHSPSSARSSPSSWAFPTTGSRWRRSSGC